MNQALAALSALAQPTRLLAFRRLVQAGPEGRVAGDLAAELAVPPATLSFHLKELAGAGLVLAVSEGRFVRYRADPARMSALLAYLTAHCCTGGDCEPPRRPRRAT